MFHLTPSLLRFLVIGLGSNVLNLLTYSLAVRLGAPVYQASLAGYAIGGIFSYHFGRIWVFDKKFAVTGTNILLFVGVYVIGGLGMSAIIAWLVERLGVHYVLAWFGGASFAFANNFLGQKWVVFRKVAKADE